MYLRVPSWNVPWKVAPCSCMCVLICYHYPGSVSEYSGNCSNRHLACASMEPNSMTPPHLGRRSLSPEKHAKGRGKNLRYPMQFSCSQIVLRQISNLMQGPCGHSRFTWVTSSSPGTVLSPVQSHLSAILWPEPTSSQNL